MTETLIQKIQHQINKRREALRPIETNLLHTEEIYVRLIWDSTSSYPRWEACHWYYKQTQPFPLRHILLQSIHPTYEESVDALWAYLDKLGVRGTMYD